MGLRRYDIVVYDRVNTQTDEIADYIINELKAPQAAEDLLADLQKAMRSLDVMPERIPLVRFEPWRSRGFRCMVARNYLIYFWIDEAARQVNITAVIYGKRDQAAKMETIIEN